VNPVEFLIQQNNQGAQLLPGHVWLAGAGPGDPRYLTVEVLCALSQADSIVFDALVDSSVLELAPQAEKIFAGKRGGKPSTSQEVICAQLIALAKEKKRVIRLKGGDPFVFGRAGEEIQALKAEGIPYRVLPGITSSFAALTRMSIPLTMRGINKAIILATGHSADDSLDVDWKALARTGQPLVVYMGLRNIDDISKELMAGGLSADTAVAVVMSAATADEKLFITTLGQVARDAAEQKFTAPALFAVGDIVACREDLLSPEP